MCRLVALILYPSKARISLPPSSSFHPAKAFRAFSPSARLNYPPLKFEYFNPALIAFLWALRGGGAEKETDFCMGV